MFESIGGWLNTHFLSLWPAAIGAAVAIPAVVLLYFLKLKRKEQVVSSTLLWQRVIEDMRVNAPFQRLKTNLLLLLQILVLMAVAAALARPFLQGLTAGRKTGFVLLIDNSASMSTRDSDGRTRLEAAKRAALKEVERVSSDVLVAVISFGTRPRILSGFTSSRTELEAAIKRIEPTGGGTDLSAALTVADGMAGALARDIKGSMGRERCRLVVFSDAAIPEDRPVKRVGPEEIDLEKYVELRSFGKPSDNVGITSLEARRSPGTVSQIFVRVANFGAGIAKRDLRIFLGEKRNAVDVKSLELAPGARKTVIFDVRAPNGLLPVRAELSAGDAFSVDDVAWAVLPEEEQLKILAYTTDQYFLLKALSNLPGGNSEIPIRNPASLPDADSQAPSEWKNYDMIIFDRCDPTFELPNSGGFMFIAPDKPPRLPDRVVKLEKQVTAPTIVDWDRSHPLVRFTSLAGVAVARARPLRLGRGSVKLLDSAEGPLIAAWQRDQLRVVAVGFDIYESNWPLRLSFPIFMANSARWLAEASPKWGGAGLRCGQPFKLHVGLWRKSPPAGPVSVEVTDPNGRSRKLEITPSRPRLYGDTEEPGLYSAEWPDGKKTLFACAVLNEAESDNSARDVVNFAVGGVRGATWSLSDAGKAGAKSGREIWKYLAILALAVMVLEWYVYNRRLWA